MKIYFITRNKHKFLEASKIMERYGIELRMLKANKVEIQARNLREIVLYSLALLYPEINKPIVVEDAGLFIRALNWFPGPYSSYVYETIGCKGILKLMESIEDRYAKFKSVVGFMDSNHIKLFEGEVEGTIAYRELGSKGFGFDPIFTPKGVNITFAQMDVEEKNRYSHRAKAFKKLAKWLANEKTK